jgi:hypothetical protein
MISRAAFNAADAERSLNPVSLAIAADSSRLYILNPLSRLVSKLGQGAV